MRLKVEFDCEMFHKSWNNLTDQQIAQSAVDILLSSVLADIDVKKIRVSFAATKIIEATVFCEQPEEE